MEHLTPHCDHTSGCITCGDEAIQMTVVSIDRERGLALCADAAGGRSSVETALVEPVEAGDRLLVHAGTAIGRDAEREVAA
ncbi:MAG TPA: HypC/HybG/HupF family hydrogenase formation chaperone [Solirubrobacterales bacterium]|nr:HypC/HybG/HupF family hydrogenase formation chaperone [Solirubrobacterales bacterium]